MQTKYTIAAVALAATLAVTGVAEAGKFSGVIYKGGSSSNAGHDIGGVFHNTDNKNDFDPIFNPKPDPVIHKVIDLDPPKPVIKYRDLGLHFGQDGTPATGAGGGIAKYRDVAKLNIGLRLNCAVGGTPVEFPDDLVIANAGLIDVAAGTRIQWQVAAAGQSGIAVLAKTLKPGKSVKFNGVLAGGVEIGTACIITGIGH